MHCLRRELTSSNPNSSEEFDDDSSAGEGDHNYGSTGGCFTCEDERDHSSTDHGAPCHDGTCSDSTGTGDHGHRSAGDSPTGQRSPGYGTSAYGTPSYGATHDDNESRRRRGWNRFLAVLTSDRRR